MLLLRHHPLNANDVRQCLRIATGATLGFLICKLFGWQNGGVLHCYADLIIRSYSTS